MAGGSPNTTDAGAPARAIGADGVAGLSVAGLMLPEAVAYAGIAGLPPSRAILAGIAGCLVYGIVGRSRFAIVSPTSSSAAILAAALATLPADAGSRESFATLAVALTGIFFLAAALLRLGGLTGFIARPVLRGFAFGLAITIVVKQLPTLAGIEAAGANVFQIAWSALAALPRWHFASVATGLLALGALLALRRLPRVPGAFLVLAGGIAASAALDLPAHGVAVVGRISFAFGWPSLPELTAATLVQLIQLAAPLALILFAESWGTMRALALRHGDEIRSDRELGALGVANLASALAQGMPVGAGLSASAANETAGAVSRRAAPIAALGLAGLLYFAVPAIALLPQPVLAAVVIAALTHALDPQPILRLFRLGRDPLIAAAAAAGVLLLGVLNGMLLAILISIVALVKRLAEPQLVALGRLGDGHDYVDIARHPEALPPPRVAIWRPAEPLFFANAERILSEIERRTRQLPPLRAVVVSLEESFDLDSTALDALIELDQRLARRGTSLRLARVQDHVRDLLAAAAAPGLLARSSYSVDDAVAALDEEKN